MKTLPTLNMDKVSNALKSKLPQFLGPWNERKTELGQSNPTFILNGQNKTLVLRRKPDGPLLKSAHMVEREYLVMKALHNTKIPVPKVFYLCVDSSEIGSVYFIMDYISGLTFAEPGLPNLTQEQRRQVYDQMNLGLSELHKLDPVSVGLSDFGRGGNFFERQLSIWSKQFQQSYTEKITEMEILEDWLSKNVPPNATKNVLVHGDWRIDNLIFSQNDFALKSVLDWELSTIGDARADLATQLMQWMMPVGEEGSGLSGLDRKRLGILEDKEYVELYSKRVGLTEVPDLTFAMAISFFRMGAILQGVKKRALDGNASNPEKGIAMGNYAKIFAQSALNYLQI